MQDPCPGSPTVLYKKPTYITYKEKPALQYNPLNIHFSCNECGILRTSEKDNDIDAEIQRLCELLQPLLRQRVAMQTSEVNEEAEPSGISDNEMDVALYQLYEYLQQRFQERLQKVRQDPELNGHGPNAKAAAKMSTHKMSDTPEIAEKAANSKLAEKAAEPKVAEKADRPKVTKRSHFL
ncbi:hypothetical protein CEXT_172361 [Caerostris extrusa]|uniref:Uncharacterized protein n=1 Tax=Caerostris extrusa TaxID=172846 RepID=A0AAV4WLE9_CAEEX|nr:hypothetical protein CEXT_172361 [Caerostris extrusa]